MEQTFRPRPPAVWTILVGAVLAAAAASIFALLEELALAGAATGIATLALVVAGWAARQLGDQRVSFLGSLIERAADAAILGSLAWALLPARVGVAALVAVSGSYVAEYVRVKAAGLGFEVRAWRLAWPLSMAVLTVGLMAGAAEAGLWGAAAISIAAALARSLEVAGRREPA